MTDKKTARRIVWAIEPYSEDSALLKAMATCLEQWTRGTDTVIEPVTILEPQPLFVSDIPLPEVALEIRQNVRNRLEKFLGSLHWPALQPLTLLTADQMSLRSAVHLLVEHAQRSKAELIAVSTHSKKAVSRFLFGSFAETLVLQDRIPVLVINPKTESKLDLKHFLYPTDLSPKSVESLREVIALAKECKARITLFHKVEYITGYTETSKHEIRGYSDLVARDIDRRRAEAESLLREIRTRGVDADLVFREEPGAIVDSILEQVEKSRASLIALVSQTGPVASAILGSVSRQLLREANCPVWVIHPGKERQASGKKAVSL